MRSVADHDWSVPLAGIDAVLDDADLTTLSAAAAFHGVSGCVFHSVRDNPIVPHRIAASLQATYHRALMTHLQALADLQTISAVLDSLDTPWLVVKGPVLAEIAYPRPDLRGYTDLDVVVPARNLAAVVDALEQAGARVLDTNWELLDRMRSSEIHLMLGRTVVDLHWHLLNIGELGHEFPLAMAPLFERARRVSLPGVTVPTLDEVDTVMHLGVHGCLSGANRLVWLKDIEQASGAPGFGWDELVARTHESGTGLPTASMLLAARVVIGTDVSNEIVSDLAGSRAWPTLVAATARLNHLERATGRRSPLRLVARSTRRDLRSSATALARRGLTGARDPLSPWPNVGGPDADDPSSASHTAGSRSDFLASVAAAWEHRP